MLELLKKISKRIVKASGIYSYIDFILFEMQKNMEKQRWEEFNNQGLLDFHNQIKEQTKDSFDYQWKELNMGRNLLSDEAFVENLQKTICTYFGDVEQDFFRGGEKEVADVGCGNGRFTYGLLSMGAKVTAMDQSAHGLENVKSVCSKFGEKLNTKQVDLLRGPIDEFENRFDIVWCYGVVHHTGNTYLAMNNVCRMVKPGGYVFMMIYGFPDSQSRFEELAKYEQMRNMTRNMCNAEKVEYLRKKYPDDLVHGYFDAISPQINDILTWEEIVNFMKLEGFNNIRKTVDNGNIHFIARKNASEC